MDRPVIAITMGDAAGIGPELIAKVLAERQAYEHCRPLIIGDPAVMQDACRLVGGGLTVRAVASAAEAYFSPRPPSMCSRPSASHWGASLWARWIRRWAGRPPSAWRGPMSWPRPGRCRASSRRRSTSRPCTRLAIPTWTSSNIWLCAKHLARIPPVPSQQVRL